MDYDIIIIGAGAAGLIAARELSAKKYKVAVVEAASGPGGRMNTIFEKGFTGHVETGAEFIHGNLPLTFKLLKEYNLPHETVDGRMITIRQGAWEMEEQHDEHWEEFMQKLKQLKTDLSIEQFLRAHFSAAKYENLRASVQRFAEGFDLADIRRASMKSVVKEWQHEEQEQYRITGGYIKLVTALVKSCDQQQVQFYYSTTAKEISYSKDHVAIELDNGHTLTCKKSVITVSAGVLQSGTLRFSPQLEQHSTAISELGFGAVIKFLLELKTPLWEDEAPEAGFLLSDEAVPTWWTQLPRKTNVLTGWLGGPKAAVRSSNTDEELLTLAIDSLASIFTKEKSWMRNQLVHHKIICWKNIDTAKGGYSYSTLGSTLAKETLLLPVENAVYFAGEACYSGESQGTVEAALQSGYHTAHKVADSL